jgi:hypothetical protein
MPSASTAAVSVVTRLVAEVAAVRCSSRLSTHLTGRPALRAANAISTMYGKIACLAPKLPPESGGVVRRSRLAGTPSARAMTGCIASGPWKFAVTS